MLLKITLLFLLFFSTVAQADFEVCQNPGLQNQPILAEGRVTPLKIYAKHVRDSLFSKESCTFIPATTLYCLLSFGQRKALENQYSCILKLKTEHKDTLALLGLPPTPHEVSVELIQSHSNELAKTYQQLKMDYLLTTGFGTDLSNLLSRYEKLMSIEEGSDWKIHGEGDQWITLKELQNLKPQMPIEATLLTGLDRISSQEMHLMNLQNLLDRSSPFQWAMLFAILGLVFSIAASKSKFINFSAKICLGLLFATEVFGMTLRVLISGRAPITNMYETVMWVGLAILILATILGIKLKNKKIWTAGFFGNLLCLFMLTFATKMLDAGIQPLVPVLRDNFWLSTHVTAVTTSYACFAFGWFSSNFVLLQFLLHGPSKISHSFIDQWNYVIRIAIQIGCVFLAAGVILGGVWADYSWGRFWGWDPKETWALIALIVYIVILHGKYVSWFKGLQFTLLGAAGFLFVIMAWFGVNYILATGLHSYGFSSGGAVFIGTLYALQLLIIGLILARTHGKAYIHS